MDSKYKLIIDSFGKDRFKVNEPIKDHTSLGIGGPAKLFFIAFSVSELVKIISMCRQLKLAFFIFGTGTKIMFSDAGFDGLIIKNRTKEIEIISIKGKASRVGIGIEEALVEVQSGVSMAAFMEFLETKKLEAEEFKKGSALDMKTLIRENDETKGNISDWIKYYKKIGKKNPLRVMENEGIAISIVDDKEVLIGLINSNATLLIRDESFTKIIKKIKRNSKGQFIDNNISYEKSSINKWLRNLNLYGKLSKEKFDFDELNKLAD